MSYAVVDARVLEALCYEVKKKIAAWREERQRLMIEHSIEGSEPGRLGRLFGRRKETPAEARKWLDDDTWNWDWRQATIGFRDDEEAANKLLALCVISPIVKVYSDHAGMIIDWLGEEKAKSILPGARAYR